MEISLEFKEKKYKYLIVFAENILKETEGRFDSTYELLIQSEIKYAKDHFVRYEALNDVAENEKQLDKAISHVSRAIVDSYRIQYVHCFNRINNFKEERKFKSSADRKLEAVEKMIQSNSSGNDIQELLSMMDNDLNELYELPLRLGKQSEILNALKIQYKEDKYRMVILIISVLFGVLSVAVNFYATHTEVFQILHKLLGCVISSRTAFAGDQIGTSNINNVMNYKSILNLIFTIGVLIAFFWSFFVSLHNDSPTKRQTAKGYTNLFAGIVIGSAKSTLGI